MSNDDGNSKYNTSVGGGMMRGAINDVDEKSSDATATTAKLNVESKRVSLRHVPQQQVSQHSQRHQQTQKQKNQRACVDVPVNVQQCQPNFCQTQHHYGVCAPQQGTPPSNYAQTIIPNTAGALGHTHASPNFCIRCHHYHPAHTLHCQQAAAHGASQSFIQVCPYPIQVTANPGAAFTQAQGCTPMIATYTYQHGANQQPTTCSAYYLSAIASMQACTPENSKTSLCSNSSSSDKCESATPLARNLVPESASKEDKSKNQPFVQNGHETRKKDEATTSSKRYNEDKAVRKESNKIADLRTEFAQIIQSSDNNRKDSLPRDNDNVEPTTPIRDNHTGLLKSKGRVSISPTPTILNTTPLSKSQLEEAVAVTSVPGPSTLNMKPSLGVSKELVVDIHVENVSFDDSEDKNLVSISPTPMDNHEILQSQELISSQPVPTHIEKHLEKAVKSKEDNDAFGDIIELKLTEPTRQANNVADEISDFVNKSENRRNSRRNSRLTNSVNGKQGKIEKDLDTDAESFIKITKNEMNEQVTQNNNDEPSFSDSIQESEIHAGNELSSTVGQQNELVKIEEIDLDEQQTIFEGKTHNDPVLEDKIEDHKNDANGEIADAGANNLQDSEHSRSLPLKGKIKHHKSRSQKGESVRLKQGKGKEGEAGKNSKPRGSTVGKDSIRGQDYRGERRMSLNKDPLMSHTNKNVVKMQPNIRRTSGMEVDNLDAEVVPPLIIPPPQSTKDEQQSLAKEVKHDDVENTRKPDVTKRKSISEQSEDQETQTIGSVRKTRESLNNFDKLVSTYMGLPLEDTDTYNSLISLISMHSQLSHLYNNDRDESGERNHTNRLESNSFRKSGSQQQKKNEPSQTTVPKTSRLQTSSGGKMSNSPKDGPDTVTDEESESVKDIFQEYLVNKSLDDTLGRIKNLFPGQNTGTFIQILSRQVASMSEVVEGEQHAAKLVRLLIGNGDIRKKAVIKEISAALEDLPNILVDFPTATLSIARYLAEIFSEENNSDWLFQVGDKLIRGVDANKSAAWGDLSINTWRMVQLKNNEGNI